MENTTQGFPAKNVAIHPTKLNLSGLHRKKMVFQELSWVEVEFAAAGPSCEKKGSMGVLLPAHQVSSPKSQVSAPKPHKPLATGPSLLFWANVL
jgi:hypothetical protein